MQPTRTVTRGSVRCQPGAGPDPVPPAGHATLLADPQAGFEFLELCGDLDAWQAPALREAFFAVPPGRPVVVDLGGVEFIDSAGLGALIGGIRRIHAGGGTITFAHPSNSVRHLFAITGLDRLAAIAA